MVSFVTRLPPLFPTLRGLSASALSHDVPAGLVLAAIALPGQLATAKLAGLPAEAGLFAFVGAIVGYALTPGYETYRGLGWFGAIELLPE